MKKLTLFFAYILWAGSAMGQTIKGTVTDAAGGYPLMGVAVALPNTEPMKGTVTDENGEFRLDEVPVGRNAIVFQYMGYKSQSIPNVLTTTGKDVILDIKLEESIESMEEVVVTAGQVTDQPLNELAKVSARSFDIETVTRYSGGRNDAARMVTNFAGVSAPNDSRNDIVVRGNSPTGLQWRINGIPIGNVNHFASTGTTGGPVTALNTNLLSTSDFLTGAFPAAYGNASAAVFDINFRNGNTDRYEFTGQIAAFTGAEAMIEGPISKENNSSFLVSYRRGIAAGIAPGTAGAPYYQDINFKINSGRTAIGTFEFFGIGGLSNIDFLGDETDENDLFANPNQDQFVENDLGMLGLSNRINLGKKTFLKSTIAASTAGAGFKQTNFIRDEEGQVINDYEATVTDNRENRYTFSSDLNHKFNARWKMNAGAMVEIFDIEFDVKDRDNTEGIPDADGDGIPDFLVQVRGSNDQLTLYRTYGQAEYKFTDDLAVTGGLNAMALPFNDSYALEPRAALSYQFKPNQRFSLAYGLHHQMVPLPVLFETAQDGPEAGENTNEDLDFYRSHHIVLAYDRSLGSDWKIKGEVYYQHLFDVPVDPSDGTYSLLNQGADFVFDSRSYLVNEGEGRNAGVEITLEKFFTKGFYGLATTSLFESQYKGSDGVWRQTAFNTNYVVNVLAGKEIRIGKDKVNALTFDTRIVTSGGAPYTPIDLEATRAAGGIEQEIEGDAFTERYDAYFRMDFRVGIRLNSQRRRISHAFYLDLQNITNRENTFVKRYNEVTDEINTVTQIGFFPDVLYRVQF